MSEELRRAALEYGGKSWNSGLPGILQIAKTNNEAVHDILAEEICLPPYQFVRCSAAERLVYDHPALQRLRRVAQLGGASLVFPSAEHTRFPHSLGVLEAAQRLMDAIDINLRQRSPKLSGPGAQWQLLEPFSAEERILLRLAALVHDIGHIPFGHTLEDELGLIEHHDSPTRFQGAAQVDTYVVTGVPIPRVSALTQREFFSGPLADLLQSLYGSVVEGIRTTSGFSPTLSVLDVLVDLIASNHTPVVDKYNDKFRISLCRELLVGPMSADVLDYIPRDKLASGVDAGHHNPRLLQYLVPMSEPGSASIPAEAQPSRLVIDLGRSRRVKTDAITAVHALFESRFELTQVVYRHPVKCASAAMLDRVVGELYEQGLLDEDDLERFAAQLIERFADEDRALQMLAARVRPAISDIPEPNGRHVAQVIELLDLLILRRLHKTELSYSPAVGKEQFDRAIHDYSGAHGRGRRIGLAQSLEADFDLSPGDIAIYSSGPRPAMKDPQLWFALDGDVVDLRSVRESRGATASAVRELVGDYFIAQTERFASLGRLEILLSSAAVAQLEGKRARALFGDVVRFALSSWRADSNQLETFERLAENLATRVGGVTTTQEVIAARGTARSTSAGYPNGMPKLRS